jgi:uncharacterized phiE125 gp8 family phage protein
MKLNLITAPSVEPVTLQQTKDHLRVDSADDDALIDNLILSARQWAESLTRRALITQTWDFFLDVFPAVIEVPRPPLQSVTSVKYLDTDGVQQTLDSALYDVDTNVEPGAIRPAWSCDWPSVRDVANAIEVRFVAGYGDAAQDLPAPIVSAILLHVQAHYDRDFRDLELLRSTAEALLGPYRIIGF